MAALLPPIDGPEAFAAAFDVSRETLDRLRTYESVLRTWQAKTNLVAPNSLDAVWHRHFADSAQLLALAPAFRTWLDLGSGAGFPGLVIAILAANHPGAVVHLVESNRRKCAFLAEIARETAVNVEIHNARIESPGLASMVSGPDVISARALADLDRLIGLARAYFTERTVALFPKGRSAEAEIAAARARWDFEARLHASRTETGAGVVELRRPRQRRDGASP